LKHMQKKINAAKSTLAPTGGCREGTVQRAGYTHTHARTSSPSPLCCCLLSRREWPRTQAVNRCCLSIRVCVTPRVTCLWH